MSVPVFGLAVRLRLAATLAAALGMTAVIAMVGALFPAVGDSIGQLDLPEGVSDLLGGADYGSISGWMKSEIGAVYGPLVIGATAITGVAATLAGEEEDGSLGLVLAYPVSRSALLLAKAAAVAVNVVVVAFGTFVGLLLGVLLAGGGIPVGHSAALALHLAVFGWVTGALALLIAGATGRRALAAGAAAGYAVLGFLVNGFAPLVDAIDWLKYLVPFHYYADGDPLVHGVQAGNLAVLLVVTGVLMAAAVALFARRDLRG